MMGENKGRLVSLRLGSAEMRVGEPLSVSVKTPADGLAWCLRDCPPQQQQVDNRSLLTDNNSYYSFSPSHMLDSILGGLLYTALEIFEIGGSPVCQNLKSKTSQRKSCINSLLIN